MALDSLSGHAGAMVPEIPALKTLNYLVTDIVKSTDKY